MRVLHFFKTYLPDSMGGIEQVIYQIARGTGRLGVNTDVLYLSQDKIPRTIPLDGHMAYAVPQDFQLASTGFSFTAFKQFSRLAENADIIHYHFPWPFMDLVHLATRVNKPSVVSYHSDIVRQKNLLKIYSPLMHRFLDSVDHIVAASPNYLATSDVLKKYPNKTSVIPYGLDRNSYSEPRPETTAHWYNKFGARFFLFVGVLRYYKGLHILLNALEGAQFPVVIVGAGPVETELKAQAKKLGLSNVHFLGQLPDEDKNALLKLSYSLVFPSHLRSEAFGISLLEGAMYGKPLISSEIGTGTSFININGETGIVVPPSNPVAFRQAMDFLWNNENIAAEMGKRSEMRYWQLFTADKVVEKYFDLYQSLKITSD
jgi:O-antigen biosynthesis rhamnosyltransferase